MKKEDRLNSLITGQTEEACDNCKYFTFDDKDPQGVGGTCSKDGEFCFCFEYCLNYEKKCCDLKKEDDSYEKMILDHDDNSEYKNQIRILSERVKKLEEIHAQQKIEISNLIKTIKSLQTCIVEQNNINKKEI